MLQLPPFVMDFEVRKQMLLLEQQQSVIKKLLFSDRGLLHDLSEELLFSPKIAS